MTFLGSQHSWSIVFGYLVFAGLCFNAGLWNDDPTEVEKGAVRWATDLESAKKQASRSGRPVFLLFQEIPG